MLLFPLELGNVESGIFLVGWRGLLVSQSRSLAGGNRSLSGAVSGTCKPMLSVLIIY